MIAPICTQPYFYGFAKHPIACEANDFSAAFPAAGCAASRPPRRKPVAFDAVNKTPCPLSANAAAGSGVSAMQRQNKMEGIRFYVLSLPCSANSRGRMLLCRRFFLILLYRVFSIVPTGQKGPQRFGVSEPLRPLFSAIGFRPGSCGAGADGAQSSPPCIAS